MSLCREPMFGRFRNRVLLPSPLGTMGKEMSAARRGAPEVGSPSVGVGPHRPSTFEKEVRDELNASRMRLQHMSMEFGLFHETGLLSQDGRAVTRSADMADHDATMMCKKVASASETTRTLFHVKNNLA